MVSILRVRDSDGNIVDIPALKGDKGDGLTDEQVTEFETNTKARHTHENKDVIDGFSVDDNEQLFYNGKPIVGSGGSGLTTAQIKALDKMFKIASYTENPTTAYESFREAFGLDEIVKMTSISATYTGGDVMEGLALHKLTGITVTGNYSDGTTEEIADYTLSGVIGKGSSAITVTYEDLTTTFVVVGIPIETLYQEVEYIEFDGKSFINTNEPAANNFEFDVTASFPQSSSERTLTALSNKTHGIVTLGHSATANRMFFFCRQSAIISNIENLYNSVVHAHCVYESSKGKTFTLEVSDKTYTATEPATVTFADEKFTFGTAGYTSARYTFIGKLYHASYTADDVLVCDLIPCYRKSDNEVGLYNKVNGMFYANAGTGTLTAGGNV